LHEPDLHDIRADAPDQPHELPGETRIVIARRRQPMHRGAAGRQAR
jgi:hypothetical protein